MEKREKTERQLNIERIDSLILDAQNELAAIKILKTPEFRNAWGRLTSKIDDMLLAVTDRLSELGLKETDHAFINGQTNILTKIKLMLDSAIDEDAKKYDARMEELRNERDEESLTELLEEEK